MQLFRLAGTSIMLTFALLGTTFGQLTVVKNLKIPNPIPKNTFGVRTVFDEETAEYGKDYDYNNGNGNADGVCAHWLRKYASPVPANVYLTGPCVLPINATREQDVVATCRAVGSAGTRTGAKLNFQLYIDPDTKKATADFQVRGNVWYGFGNEPSNTPLHHESNSFTDLDSTILVNCVGDGRK
ncbi:uncharacterized protein FA14DRAFT_158685 [Meira miltonrushii]|uniref:Uncharacterized protein n=1 Tax=Meira miltonrushii TaxID=1280837 RepID=A0A316V1U8_9BASI|nr:uncharacterized protein FA14DRAFT_158685 [Meira miltonrushii]PWN31442.1 hypothetical protein FA14DRAFT_158685 [Meira miltonrushii]